MKVIIVGCGKLGSGLAVALIKAGHAVTVIDSNPEAFELLGKSFPGKTMVGVGFDKDVLEKAQIRTSDAIVACSKSDEANALIGRISQTIYKVPHVIARLYDPRKAELFNTLGIQTISTTKWGVHRAIEMLSYTLLDNVLTIGNNNAQIIRTEIPAPFVGKTVNELTIIGEITVVAISRQNQTILPASETAFQMQDIIYIAVMATAVNKLKSLLDLS